MVGRRLEQLPTLAQEVLEMERSSKEGGTVVLGSQVSRRFQVQAAGLHLDKAALQLTAPQMKAPGEEVGSWKSSPAFKDLPGFPGALPRHSFTSAP